MDMQYVWRNDGSHFYLCSSRQHKHRRDDTTEYMMPFSFQCLQVDTIVRTIFKPSSRKSLDILAFAHSLPS